MSQRSLKRLLFVTLLAGGLAFAGPAQAQAAPVGPSQGLWKWLTRVWEEGIAVVWGQPGTGPQGYRQPSQQKQGVCIDPNGSPDLVTMGESGSVRCRSWNEQGVCIDPNG